MKRVSAARSRWKLARMQSGGVATRPVRYGDPLPVGVTMYCLQATTRRGRYVRAGIVAADPRLVPLSQSVELYVGRRYVGRFLIDDTETRIRGARIDVWTDSCREARRFGLQRGTAVLVPDAARGSASGGSDAAHRATREMTAG